MSTQNKFFHFISFKSYTDFLYLPGKSALTLSFVSVLGQEEGYTVKYTPPPEGGPEGKARGNSLRQRGIFDRIYQVET